MGHSYRVDGNVLRFRLDVGPLDIEALEAKAREMAERGQPVELSRLDGGLKITYRAGGKVATYTFRADGSVEGSVEYPEPVGDAERAFESQRRLVEEFWLRGSVARAPQAPTSRAAGSGIRALIVETARRLWEERGVAPSAREIAKALGYKSPRVLYGPDRFSSLREIYEEAGIPLEEARVFPGRVEERERVEAAPAPAPPTPTRVRELEPIEGYELEARIVGNSLEKEVEIRILGSVTRSRMRLPLEEPLVVGGSGVKVRVVPGNPPVIEIWKRKRSKRRAKRAEGEG
ncbi:MAG: hypothetical protein QI223_08155 [Candidatus Korarchaeota archaeon]|nr:hypothetical protein [Candidatus Korarchaeota archaeon]